MDIRVDKVIYDLQLPSHSAVKNKACAGGISGFSEYLVAAGMKFYIQPRYIPKRVSPMTCQSSNDFRRFKEDGHGH